MSDGNNEKKKPKSPLRRIGGIVSTVLTVAVVIICFVLIFTKSADEIMFFGDYATMYVVSPSMEPGIHSGSFIIIEKVEASEVETGDVIVFISDDPSIQGSYNTHRVIEVIGDHEEFVTKGDNNANEDSYTAKAANVKGRYVKNAEVLSAFASWFMTPAGLAITIVVIIGICCIVYVPDIVRGCREDADKRDKKERESEIERIKAEALAEAKAQLEKQQAEAGSQDGDKSGDDSRQE